MPTIETLSLPNFSDMNILEELDLSADALASQAVANVINSQEISVNDYLAYAPNEENAEIKQIQTITGQALQMTQNFIQLHREHERIIKLYGPSFHIYKAAAGADNTAPSDATFIANGVYATVSIDPDQPYTFYTDNAGGSGFFYKFTYYNPTTNTETDISLAEAIRGGGYGHYCSIEAIKKEAGLGDARRLDSTDIAARRDEVESEIKGKLASAGYVMPLQTQSGVFFVPAYIEGLTRRLTAAVILEQNYGVTKPNTNKDGGTKSVKVRDQIAEIQLTDVTLLDYNEQPMAKVQQLDGWPDDSTALIGSDGITPEPSAFTMSKKF